LTVSRCWFGLWFVRERFVGSGSTRRQNEFALSAEGGRRVLLSDIVKRRSLRVCARPASNTIQGMTSPGLGCVGWLQFAYSRRRLVRRFAGPCLTAGAIGPISKQAGLSVSALWACPVWA